MAEISFFDKIVEAPADPILGLNVAFNQDQHPQKLNLGVGAYRTEEGQPYVLQCVKKAEQIILNSAEFNKEYLPIDGHAEFNKLSAQLIFGDLAKTLSKQIVTSQSISGTGAVRLGADFVKKFLPSATVYISDPTWGNHKNIFNSAGIPIAVYRYYDLKANALDLTGFLEDLNAAPGGSVILLHACAHNPTGLDPTTEQWEKIADVIQRKHHFPFFDCAYQGFASGDLDKDAEAVRLFVKRGMELFCTQSFAKNCGLYAERVGALNVLCLSENAATAVRSQLKTIVRANYSNPPIHGALIVFLILSRPELCQEWKSELKMMADRIHRMRQLLFDTLEKKGNTLATYLEANWNVFVQWIECQTS